MKESPHIIAEEKERQGTIKCFIAAVIVVIGSLCLLVYGLAWMSTAEKVSTEIYGAKYLEGRITAMEDWRVEYNNHTHRYSDGHIK